MRGEQLPPSECARQQLETRARRRTWFCSSHLLVPIKEPINPLVRMDLAVLEQRYPNIVRAFSNRWISQQLGRPEKDRHALLVYMKNAIDDEPKILNLKRRITTATTDVEKANFGSVVEMLSIFSETLTLLEYSLGELASDAGIQTLVKELKSDYRKFLSSVSVATLACYLRDRGRLVLFPKFNLGARKKVLDLAVNLVDRQVWIEVTTPAPANVLFVAEATSASLPERAPGQLRDEFRDNFEPIIATGQLREEPIVIAIDGHWTEIDDIEVHIALDGRQPQVVSEDIETDLFVNYPGTEKVSGVVIYKRAEIMDGRMQLAGVYIRNPRAVTPLSGEEVGLLTSSPMSS